MAECFNPCEPYAESSLFQIDANRDKFTPTLTIRTNKVRFLDMLLKYINFYGSTGHTRMVPDVFVLFFLEKKYLCHFDTRCLIQGYLALEGGQASKARKLKSFWQSWENGSINEIIVKVRVRIKVHNAMVNNGQKYFTVMPKQWSENIQACHFRHWTSVFLDECPAGEFKCPSGTDGVNAKAETHVKAQTSGCIIYVCLKIK